jgi:hypothetical protein
MENVGKDEQDSDVAGHTLQVVAIIARDSVGLSIVPAGPGNPNTHRSMENDRSKDKGPLDQRQHWECVNVENVVLKRRWSGDQAGVYDQVNAHVRAHRNQAA